MNCIRFRSTRNPDHHVSLSQALELGLAADGGLFVPESFPVFQLSDFDGMNSIAEIGIKLLSPFFKGDVLESALAEICKEALDFDIPLRDLAYPTTAVLELFHGPTAAFKDVGARFLASCLSRLNAGKEKPLTILVATSGDTGSAVAAAFYKKPNTEVYVLYPNGKVSPRQEKQLTCWDTNIRAFAVEGVFDDCQRIVKEAFADSWFSENKRLSSANSINIGRLLPQMIYYAASSIWYFRKHESQAGYVIPAGNLGNALACIWVQKMGLPVREVVLATNANRSIPDYLETGEWAPRASVETLANAMDVGNPSNMERLRHLYPELSTLRKVVQAFSVDDQVISEQIQSSARRWQEIFCPHTATAMYVREQLNDADWIVVATAHPAKFEQIVEPLVGATLDIPEALADLLARPSNKVDIEKTLQALQKEIL